MDENKKIAFIGKERAKKKDSALWNRYNEVLAELDELDKLLGFSRDIGGKSLNQLASAGDEFAKRKMEQLRKMYPNSLKRNMELTAEAIQLEDELGITDEYIRILESLDFADEELDAPGPRPVK